MDPPPSPSPLGGEKEQKQDPTCGAAREARRLPLLVACYGSDGVEDCHTSKGGGMKRHLINDTPKTYALVFDPGDEVMEGLVQFANEHRIGASQFAAVGALDEVTVGFFIPAKKEYKKIT